MHPVTLKYSSSPRKIGVTVGGRSLTGKKKRCYVVVLGGLWTEKESEIRLLLSLRFNMWFLRIHSRRQTTVARVSFWCYTTNKPQKMISHNFRVTFYHFWMRKATVSHFQTQFRKNQTRFLFPRSPDFVRKNLVGCFFVTSHNPETLWEHNRTFCLCWKGVVWEE